MQIMKKTTLVAVALLIGLVSFGACAGVIDMSMDHLVYGLPYMGAIGMTTLAANQQRAYELGDRNDVDVIAADIIYQGAAVGDNAAGYARPLVAGDAFLGFADETVDNSAGAAGAKKVHLRTKGRVQLPIAGLVQTDLCSIVYASDDNTFTLVSTNNTAIGKVIRVASAGVAIVAFNAERTTI
jgi:hypothetical protein